LTTSHSLINWKWIHQLHNYDIAVYILEDKDENQLVSRANITFLSIETDMARKSGYSNANLVKRVVQAWDKALFYFTKVSRSYTEVDSSWIPERVADFHMDRPWYHSLCYAAGLSRRLLSDVLIVLEYTRTYHELEMIEILFSTISHHKKYNLYLPRQFQTIEFNDHEHVINCEDVTTHSDMWFHPIKTQAKFLSDCNLTYHPSN
jgi:hypothetical protein